MMRKVLLHTFLPLMLAFTAAHAQMPYNCEMHIEVVDTLLLPGPSPERDSVRIHLRASSGADSLWWSPSVLFAGSTAEEQWVTIGCGDTLDIKLTAYFHNVNLFHWQKPGFLRTHTGYDYIASPADGDLCRPRSITMDANPQLLCSELTTPNYLNAMVIRTDTLRCFGDSVPAFFNYDTNDLAAVTNRLLRSLLQVPFDSAYSPFYVDTIVMWDPLRNHTFVLETAKSCYQYNGDTTMALPSIIYTVQIDDTAHYFFALGRNIPLRDTTLVFSSVELPRSGLLPSAANTAHHHFNYSPRPHGVAVFRFYETPTPYYNTWPFIRFTRMEMLGDCWAGDSVRLVGPRCGCRVRDTLARSVCRSQLPYSWQGVRFAQPGTDSILIHAFECDTFHILQLSLLPDDTLSRSDTIVENALPWMLYGATFTASAIDTLLARGILPACDTLIYYRLTVIDNVYDTTLTYICPDQLPYTLQGVTVHGDTLFNIVLPGSRGQDSIITCRLHVIPVSDTAIYDTIVEDQLPWAFLDSLFTDTVSNLPFLLVNEAGCDSIVYYNLYIFWNGDHCDSSLSFPNVVTPNGDGINDRFVIGGLVENHCFPYNSLVIADRTGRIVYRAENISRDDQFWNPSERRIPAGTYFYRFVGRGIHHATQHQGCIEVLK